MSLPARLARVSAAALLTTAVGARAAAPQSPRFAGGTSADERPLRLGVAGGVVIPRTGASAHSLENGLHGQAFALLRLPGGLPALRLNVDHAQMKFDRPTGGTTSAAMPDATRTMFDGVAGMRLDLLHGPVRPYLLAGVGAFNVRDALAKAAASGTSVAGQAALARTMSSTNLGVDGGAGIAFRLGSIDGFVESRLQNVYTRQRGLVDTRSIQSFPIAFGLTF